MVTLIWHQRKRTKTPESLQANPGRNKHRRLTKVASTQGENQKQSGGKSAAVMLKEVQGINRVIRRQTLQLVDHITHAVDQVARSNKTLSITSKSENTHLNQGSRRSLRAKIIKFMRRAVRPACRLSGWFQNFPKCGSFDTDPLTVAWLYGR